MTLPSRDGGKGLKVSAIPAAHEERGYDEAGNDLFLGYVMDAGGCTAYHSGDTIPFPELNQELAGFDIDLALLPVNGRDEDRRGHGIPGNLTLDETVDLALSHRIPFVIGHHYDMFDFNTIEPEWAERRLSELLPAGSGLRYRLAKTGVRYEFRIGQFS
jgi:L-ascorbate metabolism protein UlaG (beta-lactamase superfamily)